MEFFKKITGLFSSLFGKPQFSDIEIILQDGSRIPGHKLILFLRNNSWGLDDFITADYLDLSMFPVNIIMTMLKWVYTDQVDIDGVSPESVKQLISVAKFYKLQSLYTRCETRLDRTPDADQYEIVDVDISDINVKYREDYQDFVVKLSERNLPTDLSSLASDVTDFKPVVDIETAKTPPVASDTVANSSGTMDTVATTPSVTIDTVATTPPVTMDTVAISPDTPVTMNTVATTLLVTMDTSVISDEEEENNSDSGENPSQSEENDEDEDFEVDSFSEQSNEASRCLVSKRCKCSICGKTFQNKGHLADHVIIHTGEKAFSCDVCGKAFNRKSSLVRHQNIHTNVKSYRCELCEKSFVDSSSLQKHRRIHLNIKNYTCKICSRKFTDSSNLSRHVKAHEGVKRHPCLECHRRFRDPCSLHKHSAIHDKERNFCCHFCNSNFSRLIQLKKHLLCCEISQK